MWESSHIDRQAIRNKEKLTLELEFDKKNNLSKKIDNKNILGIDKWHIPAGMHVEQKKIHGSAETEK